MRIGGRKESHRIKEGEGGGERREDRVYAPSFRARTRDMPRLATAVALRAGVASATRGAGRETSTSATGARCVRAVAGLNGRGEIRAG
jgi:hypothetical protein